MNDTLRKELSEVDTLRITCAECLGAEWRVLPEAFLKPPKHRFLVFPKLWNIDGAPCELEPATGKERMCNLVFIWENGRIPDYPGNAQDALILIDSLKLNGWTVLLSNGLDGTWECTATRSAPDATVYAPGNTLPFAVCRAFLKVHGRMEPNWHPRRV